MKKISVFAVLFVMSAALCQNAFADSAVVLRQGILGAGTGAVASAMSGGRGDRVWQSALAGAGITVVGSALLDMITGERVGTVAYPESPRAKVIIVPSKRDRRPFMRPDMQHIYREGYRDGYLNGYRDGYGYAAY